MITIAASDVGLSFPSPPAPLNKQEEMFCDEFILSDLRLFENCAKVLKVGGAAHLFAPRPVSLKITHMF